MDEEEQDYIEENNEENNDEDALSETNADDNTGDNDVDDNDVDDVDDNDTDDKSLIDDANSEISEADNGDESLSDETYDDLEYQFVDDIGSENTIHKDIIIIDPNRRRTSNVMTEYELTEAISIRSTQIEQRNIVLTDVTGLDNAEDMAKKEINDGKCPLILRRKVGEIRKNGKLTEYYEYWDVNTMSKPVEKI